MYVCMFLHFNWNDMEVLGIINSYSINVNKQKKLLCMYLSGTLNWK